jgi:hypothetical protein
MAKAKVVRVLEDGTTEDASRTRVHNDCGGMIVELWPEAIIACAKCNKHFVEAALDGETHFVDMPERGEVEWPPAQ